jgi:tetratricopeptide (TPR) repeat protein
MTHEEAEQLFTEAEKMASKAGDLKTRALLLGVYAGIRGINDGDGRAMAEMGGRAIALAEEAGDTLVYMAVAGTSYGSFLVGEHRQAVAIVDRAMELVGHDPDVSGPGTVICPYGWCVIFKGGYMTPLGELDQAAELLERGMEICREHDDIESVSWGHQWSFWRGYHAGEPGDALMHAQQAVELSDRLGSAFSRIWSWAFYGAAQMMQGHWSDATEALERALEMSQELQTGIDTYCWIRLWLAETHLGRGDVPQAIELARDGLRRSQDQGQAYAGAFGRVILSRGLLASSQSEVAEEVEAQLAAANEQAEKMEVRGLEPHIHVELAGLAALRGDEAAEQDELRRAHDLFSSIGATGHADRVAEALALRG